MTDIQQKYFDLCKNLKPFYTGDSLHLSSEHFKVEDKVVEIVYDIGSDQPADIQIFDAVGYLSPKDRLKATIDAAVEQAKIKKKIIDLSTKKSNKK